MRQEVALARAKNTAVVRPQAHQAVHRAALRVRWDVLALYAVSIVLAAFGGLVAAALDTLALGVGLLSMGCCVGIFVGEALSRSRPS